jgi:DNA-binding winged helix-turn-helix (wHTH) protein
MIHCFGECELDDERFELRRRGRPVKLEPKVFDVLAYLLLLIVLLSWVFAPPR